jgi:glycosyltransferase involved in cell wall biosynthesis
MKHLVIGSDLFKPSIGGTETVTENMAINLSKRGYRITVVAPAPKGIKSPKLEKSGSYEILRTRSYGLPIQSNLRFAFRSYNQISEYFDKPENKIDIVHVNNPFPTSKTLLRYSKKINVPCVVGGHFMPESFTVGLRRLGGVHELIDDFGWKRTVKFYNKANAVVSPTKTAIDLLKDHGLNVKTYAISNGLDLTKNKALQVDKDYLRKKYGLSSKFVITYAGRLGVEKRIDVIVTALYKLLQQDFDVQLLLIGDGNATKKLKKLIQKLGIRDKVIFTGYVGDTHQKQQLFAISDIFAIASPVELQSIVTLEAMAAGLPIFAVNEGALPELSQKHVNGDTFNEGDSATLARVIGNVLLDPVKLKQYGRASLEIIKDHNIKETWVKYDNMYREVLESYLRTT